jgi:hypothetical protein
VEPRSAATIEIVVPLLTQSRLIFFLSLSIAVFCLTGCAASLGPGYVIDKQEINVQFTPDQQPAIHVDANYRLRNNGNQPLTTVEMRLPGRRRFHTVDPHIEWDASALTTTTSPDNPRNVIIKLPESWTVTASHTLRLSVDFQPAAPGEPALSFSSDAFFLPAEGWSPQLLPARGAFATGGIPPNKWNLAVRAPNDFLVHVSGRQRKASRSGNEQTIRAEQRLGKDGYPFVIAGRYSSLQLKAAQETVHLWTRSQQKASDLQSAGDALVQTLHAYHSMFGDRSNDSHQLWIVECPVVAGCFSNSASNFSKLISGDGGKASAEMASLDSVIADFTSRSPEIAAAAAPSLASSWLGYGQNPGFYDQDPPLSALPAFVAARGLEAVQGSQVRAEIIRRALRLVPARTDSKQTEDDAIIRAKSLLFFYGLQDRYGETVFDKAVSHMLSARRGGGFDIHDLVAAFEEQVHQNVAEFVRHWMKRPGVPEDFRTRYESAPAARSLAPDTDSISAPISKETP